MVKKKTTPSKKSTYDETTYAISKLLFPDAHASVGESLSQSELMDLLKNEHVKRAIEQSSNDIEIAKADILILYKNITGRDTPLVEVPSTSDDTLKTKSQKEQGFEKPIVKRKRKTSSSTLELPTNLLDKNALQSLPFSEDWILNYFTGILQKDKVIVEKENILESRDIRSGGDVHGVKIRPLDLNEVLLLLKFQFNLMSTANNEESRALSLLPRSFSALSKQKQNGNFTTITPSDIKSCSNSLFKNGLAFFFPKNRKFQCTNCNLYFKSRGSLEFHLDQHYLKRSYSVSRLILTKSVTDPHDYSFNKIAPTLNTNGIVNFRGFFLTLPIAPLLPGQTIVSGDNELTTTTTVTISHSNEALCEYYKKLASKNVMATGQIGSLVTEDHDKIMTENLFKGLNTISDGINQKLQKNQFLQKIKNTDITPYISLAKSKCFFCGDPFETVVINGVTIMKNSISVKISINENNEYNYHEYHILLNDDRLPEYDEYIPSKRQNLNLQKDKSIIEKDLSIFHRSCLELVKIGDQSTLFIDNVFSKDEFSMNDEIVVSESNQESIGFQSGWENADEVNFMEYYTHT